MRAEQIPEASESIADQNYDRAVEMAGRIASAERELHTFLDEMGEEGREDFTRAMARRYCSTVGEDPPTEPVAWMLRTISSVDKRGLHLASIFNDEVEKKENE